MKVLASWVVVVFLVCASFVGAESRFDVAKSEGFKLEAQLQVRGITMNSVPQSEDTCKIYSEEILWKGEPLSITAAMDMIIDRWGAGPKVPVDPMSVGDRAKQAAQDSTEQMEEAVVHPFRLQEWRIHRAIMLEACGSALDKQPSDKDLETAYWLFRAANLPPAYQRIANTLVDRLHKKKDAEMVRWMCRSSHTYRNADQCDTMDTSGGLQNKEAKR